MTTLEKLSESIAYPPKPSKLHSLLIEAKSELERLEKQNTLLKSALMRIRDFESNPINDCETESQQMIRIAEEALK